MGNEGKFKCKLCEDRFDQKEQLDEHIDEVHSNQSKIKCNQCDKWFSRKRSLEEHVSVVHLKEKSTNVQNVVSHSLPKVFVSRTWRFTQKKNLTSVVNVIRVSTTNIFLLDIYQSIIRTRLTHRVSNVLIVTKYFPAK